MVVRFLFKLEAILFCYIITRIAAGQNTCGMQFSRRIQLHEAGACPSFLAMLHWGIQAQIISWTLGASSSWKRFTTHGQVHRQHRLPSWDLENLILSLYLFDAW